MAVIKPTIGRVVWFFNGPMKGSDQPLDAHITYVHSDSLINIGGFDAVGVPYARTSVPLIQEGEECPDGPHCMWMPYQQSQAAKQAQPETVSEAAKRGFGAR